MKKEYFLKIKGRLPQVLNFFLCNFLPAIVVWVLMLTGLFAVILIANASEYHFWLDLISDWIDLIYDWIDLIFGLIVIFGFIFVFYFKFFVANQEYKRFYFKKIEEGYSVQDWMKAHLAEYSKYELILLLIISVIPVIVSQHSWLYSCLSFLYISAFIFEDFVSRYLITNIPSFLARLIGVIFWDAFVAGTYLICLRLVYRKWEKGCLGKSNTQQGG